MSRNIVFYFSGTGNSYHVAKTISDKIHADLVPIVTLKKLDSIEAGLLVFVFPVYDFKPPKIVTEIIENLGGMNANKIVAVATYGVSLSSTLYHFETTLLKKGMTLSQGYGIKYPHNAVGSIGFSEIDDNTRLVEADHKINTILNNIESMAIKNIEKTSILDDLTIVKQLPHAFRLLSVLFFKGAKALEFTVTQDCINCNLCKNICPVCNIESDLGKPKFGDRCTSCFACIQWCPKSAIHIGKYNFKEIGMKHYHHPKVVATDLILNHPIKCEEV